MFVQQPQNSNAPNRNIGSHGLSPASQTNGHRQREVEYDAFSTLVRRAQPVKASSGFKGPIRLRSVDRMIDTIVYRRRRTQKVDGSMGDRTASALNLTPNRETGRGNAGHRSG